MIFQEKWFSCYILLTDQISLSDFLYFLKYLTICVLWLFVNQAVASQNLKITASFLSSHFATSRKSQDKNLNILRMKTAFEMKQKAFFIIFKWLSVTKNWFRPESVPLNNYKKCVSFNLKSSFCSQNIQIFVFSGSPQFFPVSHWLRWFKINLEVYDVTIYLKKNLITHLVSYLDKEKRYDIETLSIDRVLCNSNIFMEKSCRNCAPKASPRSLLNFGK